VKNDLVTPNEMVNGANYVISTTLLFQFLSGTFQMSLKPGEDSGRILDRSRVRELVHIKGFTLSRQSLEAASLVCSIIKDMEIIKKSDIYNLAFLIKGNTSSGVISVDTENQESFEQFKEDFSKNQSGAENSGKAVVAQGKDVSYASFGANNRDMEVKKNKEDARATVYQKFLIPGPIVDGKQQSLNNYQVALLALYDLAVLPLADVIFEGYTKIFRDRGVLKDGETITYDLSTISALEPRTIQALKEDP